MVGIESNGPNGQVYPTVSNNLVEMMNSGTFEPDPFKLRSKRGNCKKKKKEEKDKETVGAFLKQSSTNQ